MFSSIFTDAGEFDRESFVKFVEENVHIKSPEDIDKELMAAFEKFDTNKNFLISKDEFHHIMMSDNMGDEPLTEEEADELLGNLDVDGDGQLNIIGNNCRVHVLCISLSCWISGPICAILQPKQWALLVP